MELSLYCHGKIKRTTKVQCTAGGIVNIYMYAIAQTIHLSSLCLYRFVDKAAARLLAGCEAFCTTRAFCYSKPA